MVDNCYIENISIGIIIEIMYLVSKNGINRYYVNDISWNHLLINTRVDNNMLMEQQIIKNTYYIILHSSAIYVHYLKLLLRNKLIILCNMIY